MADVLPGGDPSISPWEWGVGSRESIPQAFRMLLTPVLNAPHYQLGYQQQCRFCETLLQAAHFHPSSLFYNWHTAGPALMGGTGITVPSEQFSLAA